MTDPRDDTPAGDAPSPAGPHPIDRLHAAGTATTTRRLRREDVVTALAEAVTAVPGVARLAPGALVEVATHYPGGKVVGVRLGEQVEIHIVADRVPLRPLADEVAAAARRVLAASGDRRPVRVVVDDVTAAALRRRRA